MEPARRLQQRAHPRQVAELDVVRRSSPSRTGRRRCTDGATTRRSAPGFGTSRGDAPLRETEQRAHEGERRDRVPLLLLALGMAERIECSRHDEVRRDRRRAPRLQTALTMPRYALALTGFRSRLRFGSFQTWKTCSAGTPMREPVVVGRERGRERAEGGGPRSAAVDAARLRARTPSSACPDDVEDRCQAGRVGFAHGRVERRPVVARRGRVGGVEVDRRRRRRDGPPRTASLTYEAPVAAAIGNAVACCGPSNSGSRSAVRSGIVPPVEITRWRAVFADAVAAAATTSRPTAAETASQRSTPRPGMQRANALKETPTTRTVGRS